MKEITGVSSMAVAIVASIGSIRYGIKGYGVEPFIPYLIIGGIIGALAGNKINTGLNNNALKKIFSIVLFITALRMNYIISTTDIAMDNMFIFIAIGFASGILAGLLGLGGGVVRIPGLLIFIFCSDNFIFLLKFFHIISSVNSGAEAIPINPFIFL